MAGFTRACGKCGSNVHIAAKNCQACGEAMPRKEKPVPAYEQGPPRPAPGVLLTTQNRDRGGPRPGALVGFRNRKSKEEREAAKLAEQTSVEALTEAPDPLSSVPVAESVLTPVEPEPRMHLTSVETAPPVALLPLPPAAPVHVHIGYIVVRDFMCPVNGVLTQFERGKLVRDNRIGAKLLMDKCPVMEIDLSALIVCPHCSKAFPKPPDMSAAAA